MSNLINADREDLRFIVDGDNVRRLLPARFVLTGSAHDLRFLARTILDSVSDEDYYTDMDILVSLPRPAECGSVIVGWNERLGV